MNSEIPEREVGKAKANVVEAGSLIESRPRREGRQVPSNPNPKGMIPKQVAVRFEELGERATELFERGKVTALELGRVIAEAKDQYSKIGRDSQYPVWHSQYLPQLGRKTADRLEQVYRTLLKGNPDNLSTFPEKLQLSAAYALASPNVSQGVRDRAMEAALQGQEVNCEFVLKLVQKEKGPVRPEGSGKRKPATRVLKLELPGITVRVTVGAESQLKPEEALEEVLRAYRSSKESSSEVRSQGENS